MQKKSLQRYFVVYPFRFSIDLTLMPSMQLLEIDFFVHSGAEPVEEDVDICGNASPILIEKDPQIITDKCGSPSSSSSDSGSSSSGVYI